MAKLFLFSFLLVHTFALSQSTPQKLAAAFKAFQTDEQMQHGVASLCVADAKTGKIIFAEHEKMGLVPASTLKVITAATAYELLGRDFRYQTKFAYHVKPEGAEVLVLPSGDPTFGSWRWSSTRTVNVLQSLEQALQKAEIKSINSVTVNNHNWNAEAIPDGWLWQDIGNYYGAGATKLNWRENQFDVILRSGSKEGSAVSVVKVEPEIYGYKFHSEVTAAAPGSGDSAYIYFPLQGSTATIRGTIPINKNAFEISGAMPSPANQFVHSFLDHFSEKGIKIESKNWRQTHEKPALQLYQIFHTVTSPSLDSIVYWLNRKSVNLYAEALLKTIAEKQTGEGSTGNGVAAMQNYWKQKDISEAELNIYDGSGLSPLNRITTQAQVKVLQHARKQNWYSGFYNSLPTYNGMKMKSGTMQNVKGFCGYHRDSSGNEYVFSFLVNNYAGSSVAITQKMYKVLNELK